MGKIEALQKISKQLAGVPHTLPLTRHSLAGFLSDYVTDRARALRVFPSRAGVSDAPIFLLPQPIAQPGTVA